MKQMLLVFWFFFVTSLAMIGYQYRQGLQLWFKKIYAEHKGTGISLWEHPSLKWSLRIFLIFTAVAWLDLVIWGITSVLPLALFLVVFGGRQALSKNAHILMVLAAFWVVCMLLWGMTPAEFLSRFDIQVLCKLYGVSAPMIRPLVIPLVALFFLGVASLIWRTHVMWGVGAILVATCLPFLIGFLFGELAEGVGGRTVDFLASFYHVTPSLLKYLLLPQAVLIMAGVLLLTKRGIFGGVILMVLGLALPLTVVPIKLLHNSLSSQASFENALQALAGFYGISLDFLKLILILQIVLLFSCIIMASRRRTSAGLSVFFLFLFLPWLAIGVRQAVDQVFLPLWHKSSQHIDSLARFYNRPVDVVEVLLIPMSVTFALGFLLLFKKSLSGLGLLLLLSSVALPWLADPLANVLAQLSSVKIDGLAELYNLPAGYLKPLLIPMAAFFMLGIIAIYKNRGFWGGLLILGALFLPWIFEPLKNVFLTLSQWKYPYGLLIYYYKITSTELAFYLPAMILLSAGGFLLITVKDRIVFGIMLLFTAIYLPFWLSGFYELLKRLGQLKGIRF